MVLGKFRATIDFVADGESDSFTWVGLATDHNQAIDKAIAAAEREYGGDWDEITEAKAVAV